MAGAVILREHWEARARRLLRDAQRLHRGGGSSETVYYLCGCAVECALKGLIMKRNRWNQWPSRDVEPKIYTHSLKRLLKLAGLSPEMQNEIDHHTDLSGNWLVVKDWEPKARYGQGGMPPPVLRHMLRAVGHRNDGVLPWLLSIYQKP
jgi:HEPN domain-containing protein